MLVFLTIFDRATHCLLKLHLFEPNEDTALALCTNHCHFEIVFIIGNILNRFT